MFGIYANQSQLYSQQDFFLDNHSYAGEDITAMVSGAKGQIYSKQHWNAKKIRRVQKKTLQSLLTLNPVNRKSTSKVPDPDKRPEKSKSWLHDSEYGSDIESPEFSPLKSNHVVISDSTNSVSL